MGLLKKAMFVVVAKQLVDQARKPENQRKAREALASLRQRRGTSPR